MLPTLLGIFGLLHSFRRQRYCFSLICAKFILVHFRFAPWIACGVGKTTVCMYTNKDRNIVVIGIEKVCKLKLLFKFTHLKIAECY